MKPPLFSVIVPVYNTEKYVDECAESLLNQTFTDFEIIFIDNGSVDNSLEIIRRYEQKHDKVRVLGVPHTNVGDVRNFALEQAKGEYVCFIDSDDYLERDSLELFADKVEGADIIVFGAKTLNNKTKKVKSGQYSSAKFKKEFDKKDLFQYHTVCWNKVYRKSFLQEKGIRFASMAVAEDQIFFLKTMLLAENVTVLQEDLYYYRKNRPNSLTSNKVKTGDYPLQNIPIVKDFLDGLVMDAVLKTRIMTKYLLKAISWSRRIVPEEKELYFEKLTKVLERFRLMPNFPWLRFFRPNVKYSSFRQKLQYLKLRIIVSLIG